MSIRKVLIGLGLLGILLQGDVSGVYALDIKQVAERVQEQYMNMRDLEADFSQEAYNLTLNQTQTAAGKLYLKKPGRMRWDYDPPEEQLFLIKDGTMWWYTPKNNQVIVKKLKASYDLELPLSFMNGMGNLDHDFYIKAPGPQEAKEAGGYALSLMPKKPQATLKRMLLEVDRQTFNINKITMYDFYGNKTQLQFSHHKLNTGLPETKFNFTPPPGAQTIVQ